MKQHFLVEQSFNNIQNEEVLEEATGKKDLYISGIFMQGAKKNRNVYHMNKYERWYYNIITPWGVYNSLKNTVSNAPFKINEATILKYCKKENKKLLSHNPSIRKEWWGVSPFDLGFDFKERSIVNG